MINILTDNVLLEIFNFCRLDEAPTLRHLPWKWYRLAHVCRTWRDIIFASSRHLNLELLCTFRIPVRNTLRFLPTLPIVIGLPVPFKHDEDNIIAALEHPDRVQSIGLGVPRSLLEKMVTVMQRPFPALVYLKLDSNSTNMPVLPDAFLGGCAPRLQGVSLYDIPFPAAPTLLLSARDLIDVSLRSIPATGYISPEAMATSLAALSRLESLALGFQHGSWGPSFLDRIPQPPITRVVLPALTTFDFDGLFEYLEDFVAQIDAPQLKCFNVEYSDEGEGEGVNFQVPQLRKFIDRSEHFGLSRFRHAVLDIQPCNFALYHGNQSSFRLRIPDEGISQVLSQISGILSNVDCFWIYSTSAEYDELLANDIRWLELLLPFTAVKALIVLGELSRCIALTFRRIAGERAAEVLPALELLCLEDEPVKRVKKFVAARQNVGRPVIVINSESEFRERFEFDVSE